MKKLIFVALTGAVIALACSKEKAGKNIASQGDLTATSELQSANLVASTCDQFAYPDTIFYPAELPSDYVVKPLAPLTGTYGAFPDGLKINALNGNIDITESETGLQYIVWFVAKGAKDTCKRYITVSGVNYTDSIYVLANNPGVATPVYNANPLQATDCKGGCEFDDGPDDDDGDGIADEPPAGQEVIPQGISMNKITGAINLRKSLQNGALGKNPLPGTYKDFILNYRIGDKSSKALNKIGFRIYYYKTQSQIPASLKSELAVKKSEVLLENENESSGNSGGRQSLSINFVAASTSKTAKHGTGEVKCRPPYIIVTQQ